MADNFGLKIGVEGEKEFKKALADINQSFKVLGSEMKLVTSGKDLQAVKPGQCGVLLTVESGAAAAGSLCVRLTGKVLGGTIMRK